MYWPSILLLLAFISQTAIASVLHGALNGRTFDKDGKEIGPAPSSVVFSMDTTIYSTVTVYVDGDAVTSTIPITSVGSPKESGSSITSSINTLTDKDKDETFTVVGSGKDKLTAVPSKDFTSSEYDKDKMTSTVPDKDKESTTSVEGLSGSSTPTSVGLKNQSAMSRKPLSIWQSYSKPESMPLMTGLASENKSSWNKTSYLQGPSSSLPTNGTLTASSAGSDKDKLMPTVYFPSYLVGTPPNSTKVMPTIPYYTPSPLPNPTSSPVFTPDTLGHAYGGGWYCVPQKYEPLTGNMSDKKSMLGGTATGSAMPYMPTGNTSVPVVPKFPVVQAMYQSGVTIARYSSGLLAVALISVTVLL